jgi:hypothetical protein
VALDLMSARDRAKTVAGAMTGRLPDDPTGRVGGDVAVARVD